ncbi:MAG TPA: DMT family transporter [Candidatus Dormibacteraeota bacterium]|nr:DMT family transporter [Candidatus Dormibacteraeota bacterium]
MSRRGQVLFATMCVVWGVPYLLIKVAVEDLQPVTLVALRTGAAALLLVPVAAQRGALRPLLRRWRTVLVYSVVEVALPWLLLSDAERHLSSSLSGLLVAAVPLVGVVLTSLVGGEAPFGARRVLGLLVGLAGVGVLLGVDVGGGDLGAVMEMGVVTVCYATGPLLIARRLADLPSIGVVAASLVVSAAVCTPPAVTRLPGAFPPGRVVASVAVLAVLCTAVAFVVFFALIAEVGPVRATVITYVNPAVAVLLGVALLGEPFTAGTAGGFALILAGCVLATRRGPRPRATDAAGTAAGAATAAHAETVPSG